MAHNSNPRNSQWYVQTPTRGLIVTSANVSCKGVQIKCWHLCVKSGSQYDTGAASVTRDISITGKKYLFTSQNLFLMLISLTI